MKTLLRHILSIALLIGLVWVFSQGREDLHPVHFWNRAIADAAFALLCFTLIIGPAARFIPKMAPLLPWRRELGIGFTVGAILHVSVYAGFKWENVLKFFTRTEHSETILLNNAYAAANWLGVIALLYAVVLTLTSNDISQKWLGKGWKFLQQQSYTLFVLAALHVGLLLALVIKSGRGVFPPAFLLLAGATVGLQLAGYVRTVWLQARRRKIRRGAK